MRWQDLPSAIRGAEDASEGKAPAALGRFCATGGLRCLGERRGSHKELWSCECSRPTSQRIVEEDPAVRFEGGPTGLERTTNHAQVSIIPTLMCGEAGFSLRASAT